MKASAPAPNFDRVARLYRWAEYLALGPLLQRTRIAHLDKLKDRRNALLFGDGDGRFLACLLSQNPALHATAVDLSAAMLNLLAQRCHQAGSRLTTLQAAAQQVPIPPGVDLIVTHFFLDCLTQPEVDTLTRRIAAAIPPGTLWLISDFAIPTSPVLRPPARLYIRALYFAFRVLTGLRVTTLPDPQSALIAAGFRHLGCNQKLGGLLYSELWAFDPPVNPSDLTGTTPSSPSLIHSPMVTGNPTAEPAVMDPLPNPEPIAPSLDKPDPGVFHHEPGAPQKQPE